MVIISVHLVWETVGGRAESSEVHRNPPSPIRHKQKKMREIPIYRYLFVSFVTSLVCVAASPQIFTTDDYGKIARVSDPHFSPRGDKIVFVVSHPDYRTDTRPSHLYLIDTRGGVYRNLTPDRTSARYPRWSPTGDRIAFLSDVREKSQIFILPRDGGEAREITHSETGVSAFAWSPDGKMIAFLSSDAPLKRDEYDDAFEAGENDYLSVSAARSIRLWTVDTNDGEAKQLTEGKSSVGRPELSWSPDGHQIAFVSVPSAGDRDSDKRTIETISSSGGESRALRGTEGQGCYLQTFSPDGAWITVDCPIDGDRKNELELRLISISGREPKRLTSELDRNFFYASWSSDSKSLIAAANDGTRTALWTISLMGPPLRWATGDITLKDVDIDLRGRAIYIGSEPHHPDELFIQEGTNTPPKRLTNLNTDIASLHLGKTESISWTSPDGLPLTGVLTYPPGFTSSSQWPLVLLLHGGPWTSSHDTFVALPQLFASHGWIVFEPNYRGSDGSGNRVYSAIFADHGDGPGRDVISGLDILRNRRYIAGTKVAVSGWSYGGYMTAWLITHYDRWLAAMAGGAVLNLAEDYNLNDMRLYRLAFGEFLWSKEALDLLQRQSPLTYYDKINTPLLLIADTFDKRVPITQSYELYRALKERGKDVTLVVYPVPQHMPTDPYRERDLDSRWVTWFDEHRK